MAKGSQTLNAHFLLRVALQSTPLHRPRPPHLPHPHLLLASAMWCGMQRGVKEEFGAEVERDEAPGFLG